VEDLPSDDGDQNDKQRSCFWWFMEVGERGGMTGRSGTGGWALRHPSSPTSELESVFEKQMPEFMTKRRP
jgi:hypothetical protein